MKSAWGNDIDHEKSVLIHKLREIYLNNNLSHGDTHIYCYRQDEEETVFQTRHFLDPYNDDIRRIKMKYWLADHMSPLFGKLPLFGRQKSRSLQLQQQKRYNSCRDPELQAKNEALKNVLIPLYKKLGKDPPNEIDICYGECAMVPPIDMLPEIFGYRPTMEELHSLEFMDFGHESNCETETDDDSEEEN